jgi:multiple sugar transport system ATP-binding protein
MVFQSDALYPTMTVRRNITFGMAIRGVPKAARNAALEEVARLLQIEALLDRKPARLSGGQRQRVAMARALVREPDVFLFDEPLSNLDATLRGDMRTEIKRLHRRLGRTMVYVTHDPIEAMTLASRIALLHEGRIQQVGDPITVYDHPANMVVAKAIGSPPMNFLVGRIAEAGGRVGIEVADPGGATLFPLAVPPDPAAAPAGRNVILGLRPEAIGRSLDSASPSAQAIIEGIVEVVEPTGPDTMLVLSLGAQSLIARVPPADAPPVGATCRFTVDMSKASVFDPETGERL